MKCIIFKNANMCKLMNAVFDIVTHNERLSSKLIFTDKVSYSFMTKKGIFLPESAKVPSVLSAFAEFFILLSL